MADVTINQLSTVRALSANNFIPISDGTTTTKLGTDSIYGFRNKIINGDMRIDQRNTGSAVTPLNNVVSYAVDRFRLDPSVSSKFTSQQNANNITPPPGFSNYIGCTSSSSYSLTNTDYFNLYQGIEGFNCSDLAWGTVNAKTVTLSFWVRSSLTGTFGGMVNNSTQNRSYAFTYQINFANTWEYKTVIIPGDTSGTWLTNTGVGMWIGFSLGAGSTYSQPANTWSNGTFFAPNGAVSLVGTNGAVLYITGVQLEEGSTATPFERRPFGLEFDLCKRYYFKQVPSTMDVYLSVYSSGGTIGYWYWGTSMRAVPTVTGTTNTGGGGFGWYATTTGVSIYSPGGNNTARNLVADAEL